MKDKDNGFIVGEGGLILKTTDGGNNWIPNKKPETSIITSSYFFDKNTGWMVGGNGAILYTSDGGNNWNKKNTSPTGDLLSVVFLNKDTGFISGYGAVWKTTNSGADWAVCYKDIYGSKLPQIVINGDSTIYFHGSRYDLLSSKDYGLTWSSKYTGMYDADRALCCYGNNIWAVGINGCVICSTDRGDKWSLQYSGTYYYLNSIFFIDENNGWAAGEHGVIIRTTDGGKNWLPVESRMINDLYQINFIDKLSGWVAGSSGTIARSIDGGKSWSIVQSGLTDKFYTISFVDKNTGWFGGTGGTIYKYMNNPTHISENSEKDFDYRLEQNYPNPFNPRTKIAYSLTKESLVKLTVYDIKGQVVSELVRSTLKKGSYETTFSGEKIGSGVYIYSLHILPTDGSSPVTLNKKLLLLK